MRDKEGEQEQRLMLREPGKLEWGLWGKDLENGGRRGDQMDGRSQPPRCEFSYSTSTEMLMKIFTDQFPRGSNGYH